MKRNVFIEKSKEDAFNDKGFITLDLLTPNQLNELFELLKEIQESEKQDVNVESDYELSFFKRDASYRKMVRDKIYAFFKPQLDEILDGYEPLIVNLFNKKTEFRRGAYSSKLDVC